MAYLLNVSQWTGTLKASTFSSLNLKTMDFELNLPNALKVAGGAFVSASAIYLVLVFFLLKNNN